MTSGSSVRATLPTVPATPNHRTFYVRDDVGQVFIVFRAVAAGRLVEGVSRVGVRTIPGGMSSGALDDHFALPFLPPACWLSER